MQKLIKSIKYVQKRSNTYIVSLSVELKVMESLLQNRKLYSDRYLHLVKRRKDRIHFCIEFVENFSFKIADKT